jgi:hypothetical protein
MLSFRSTRRNKQVVSTLIPKINRWTSTRLFTKWSKNVVPIFYVKLAQKMNILSYMESKNYNFVSATVSSCKKNYDESGNNKYFLNVYLG